MNEFEFFLPKFKEKLENDTLNFDRIRNSIYYRDMEDLPCTSMRTHYRSLLKNKILSLSPNQLDFVDYVQLKQEEMMKNWAERKNKIWKSNEELMVWRARIKRVFPSFVREHHLELVLRAFCDNIFNILVSDKIDFNGLDFLLEFKYVPIEEILGEKIYNTIPDHGKKFMGIKSHKGSKRANDFEKIKENTRHPLPDGLLWHKFCSGNIDEQLIVGDFELHTEKAVDIILNICMNNLNKLFSINDFSQDWQSRILNYQK